MRHIANRCRRGCRARSGRCGLVALLALLIALLAFGGWYGARFQQRYRERHLVESQLEPAGATARYWQGHVVQIAFSGPKFRPQVIPLLKRFPRLSRLVLIDVQLAAEDLANFPVAQQLKEIVFINVPLGDAALRHVATFSNVEYLQLSGTRVTSDGLTVLTQLPVLRRLDLRGNGLGAEAVEPLAQLTHLDALNISEPSITRNDLEQLRQRLPQTRIP